MSRTIVLIHGTADASANWHRWGRLLDRRGWQTVVVDLPGYGCSPTQATCDSSVSACVAHLLPLLERRQPVALFGHSLGANVAIELALSGVAPVERLLLACPAVEMPAPTIAFYDWFVGAPLETLYAWRKWFEPLVAPFPRIATASTTAPQSIRGTWESLKSWQPPDWSTLTIPTAIVGGLWDHIAPPGSLRTLASSLPDARLTLLPCRHLPMDSTPVGFGRWLVRSLEG